MHENYNNFLAHYNKKDLDIYPVAYSKSVYSFTFHLIENPDDINEIFDEEINDKIKKTSDVIIDFNVHYPSYFVFCIEEMLIVINIEHLSLLNDYFINNRNLKFFFINNAEKNIANHSDPNIHNIFYNIIKDKKSNEDLDTIKSLEWSEIKFAINKKDSNKFADVIKESFLIYQIVKSFYKTYCNRFDNYFKDKESQIKLDKLKEDEYDVLKSVGSGSGGFVKLFYYIEKKFLFVGKIYNVSPSDEPDKLREREMTNLENISHPNIPKFYGKFEYGNQTAVATEFINGHTLSNLLKREKIELKEKIKFLFKL